jgi:hypothetical protein
VRERIGQRNSTAIAHRIRCELKKKSFEKKKEKKKSKVSLRCSSSDSLLASIAATALTPSTPIRLSAKKKSGFFEQTSTTVLDARRAVFLAFQTDVHQRLVHAQRARQRRGAVVANSVICQKSNHLRIEAMQADDTNLSNPVSSASCCS